MDVSGRICPGGFQDAAECGPGWASDGKAGREPYVGVVAGKPGAVCFWPDWPFVFGWCFGPRRGVLLVCAAICASSYDSARKTAFFRLDPVSAVAAGGDGFGQD